MVHVRSAEEKTTGMPELQKIAQMQAAGWGGGGTIQESVVAYCKVSMQDSFQPSRSEMIAATPSNSQVDYSQYDLPRVFRTSKSSHDAPLMANSARISHDLDLDAEFYEVPPFLRKQADEDRTPSIKVDPLLPRDVVAIANANIAPKISLNLFVREVEMKKPRRGLSN